MLQLFHQTICLYGVSIWSVAFLAELVVFLWVKVCLFYILYVPVIFGLLMVLIEVVGYTVRLITLGFRLSANILRGHLIIDCMIRGSMVNVNKFIRLLGYIGRVLTLVLELGIIFIQAFVFSLLSCIYLSEAYVYSILLALILSFIVEWTPCGNNHVNFEYLSIL